MCTGANGGLVLASVGCTEGAGPTPGATANVSMLKRPTNVPWARPLASVSRSPWYQETPNGGFGSCVTKKSKSVFGGSP